MKTAGEYRAMAEECFKWAREAQDETRVATITTNPQVTGGRNLFMELRPVSKDRYSLTSVLLTGDFLRSAKLRRCLAHQINHSFLVNGRNNRTAPDNEAGGLFFDRSGRREAAVRLC